MSLRRTITLPIIPAQDALVRACQRSSGFASTGEVVRAAPRLLERDKIGSSHAGPAVGGGQAVGDRA